MYLVRFIRKDLEPNEEYYYNTEMDAKNHFNLFRADDSGLYSRIEIVEIQKDIETVSQSLIF